MTDIWNLSALCRCCHIDGSFKSLEQPYPCGDLVEVYAVMLQDTFGISISKPPIGLSYSICDVCIYKLRETLKFKLQITSCEQKFHEYLSNEEAFNHKEIKVELELCDSNGIKCENSNDSDHYDNTGFDVDLDFKSEDIEIKDEDKKGVVTRANSSKAKLKKTPSAVKVRKKKTSDQSVQLTVEKAKAKKERKVPCYKCDIVFSSRLKLLQHQNTEHSSYKGPYTCADCDHRSDDIDQIYKHVMEKHSKTTVKCRFCVKEFAKRSLVPHESSVHIKESVYICDVCNKQFPYRSSLRKHLLWHEGLNKRVFCELCGHGFNDTCNLKLHVEAVHLKLRKFACADCDKTFTTKKHLKAHTALKHGGVKPHACSLCRAVFWTWRGLHRHQALHEDKRPAAGAGQADTVYRCKAKGCTEKFDNRGVFKAHVLKHNRDGSSPHICHVCGQGYTCKYSLNRHVEGHNGIKRFACDICHRRFTQKAVVERHMKSLHNPLKTEKPEKTQCPICKIKVRDMEKHHKRHIIRPYACEMCDKTYPERNALNRHRKEIHLGIVKHGCSSCNMKFKTATRLQKHLMKRHKNGDECAGSSGLQLPEISFGQI